MGRLYIYIYVYIFLFVCLILESFFFWRELDCQSYLMGVDVNDDNVERLIYDIYIYTYSQRT